VNWTRAGLLSRCINWMGLTDPWLLVLVVVGSQATAADAQPRIVSAVMSSNGTFQMTWSAPAGFPGVTEASDSTGAWEPVQVGIASGGLDPVNDPDAAPRPHRFYRIQVGRIDLSVPETRLIPGSPLVVSAPGLDPSARLHLMFQDPHGVTTAVRAHSVTLSNAVAIVPPIPDPTVPGFRSGPTTVWVRETRPTGITTRLASRPVDIGSMPTSNLPRGALTLGYLARLETLLQGAAREWNTIAAASEGVVDAAPLVSRLQSLRSEVEKARQEISRVVSGQEPQVLLGRISGREWVLNPEGIDTLDRLIAALLARQIPQAPLFGSGGRQPQESGCDDPMACLDALFMDADGPDTAGILAAFDRFHAAAGAGVAIAAASAVVLGVATAPAAAAFAGTAGAVLFFANYVVPAVMASSSMAFAHEATPESCACPIFRARASFGDKPSPALPSGQTFPSLFAGDCPDLFTGFNPAGVPPQTFQVVLLTDFLAHDVDDHVEEIHDQPATL